MLNRSSLVSANAFKKGWEALSHRSYQLEWLAVGLLTGLAFLVRRNSLGNQSLWFDEADLVARASDNLGKILENFFKAGENGPLYTLLMHFWIQIFGNSELAVRTPSLLAGTTAVPLLYLAARKLGGTKVALLAALLLTLSPYNVWYSQDAKMYPLALCLTLASVWLFLKALEDRRWRWWVAYIIITTLGFYIHVMAAMIVGVEIAYYFGLRWYKKSPNLYNGKRILISFGLLTLPYLPLALWQLIALWDGTVGATWFVPVSLPEMLNSLLRRFALNRSVEPWETIGALVFLVLAILGLFKVWRKPSRTENNAFFSPAIFLTLYLVLPILSFYLLTTRIPLFAERYLLIASPAYYILAAMGLVWLATRRMTMVFALLGLAFVLVMALVALVNVNYSKEAQKEDWREAMKQLTAQLRPGDIVFVVPGYLETAVRYYLKPGSDVAIQTIPESILAPKAVGDTDDIALNDYVQRSIRSYERAWLVISPERYQREDPQEFLRKVWFDNNTYTIGDPLEFVGVEILKYSFAQIPGTNVDFYPRSSLTDYKFGNTILLEGYDYLSNGAGRILPTGTVQQGDNLHLTLYFRKLLPDTTDYEISVRLVTSNGEDTATNYTTRALSGYYPTSIWQPYRGVRDYREIYIKVPTGEYRLEVSLNPVGKPEQKVLVSGREGQNLLTNANKVLLSLPVTVVLRQ
ncbi:MAG: glycosyltransferase family 39 protein [Chloroflexi bacterium]|uniref:Glycosyltransferase family 39 protein n=1 Tax=Candidatus Chlorohelix allophototropha TaxID=3003348 RepID=A0A8T7LUE7_9CHLR|nr:glycosyltransferase family 39 protein [Chloroflexota bacterium]WJW66396.1 glycosyltransferase family 39 protein [Chloroflexota bacterium L227-S17]